MIIRHFLLLLTVFLFLSAANIPVYSQTNVGEFGKYKITLEEFEYAYAKNVGGWEAAEEDSFSQYKDFMDLYMNFRMKLRNAEVRSFDTDPELQNELEDYQRQVGESYIIEKYIIQPGVELLYERRKEELRVSHIMIRPGEDGDEGAFEKANAILDSINNGASFEEMAGKYSDDQFSGPKGGDIFFITAGLLPYEFDDAMYTLQAGEVYPEPVKTNYGYHLIKITERHPRTPKIKASHILISYFDANGEVDSAAAKLTADTVLVKLSEGESFESLVEEYSDDTGTKIKAGDLGFFERRQMVQAFDETAFNMNVGEISGLVQTNFGYHIIKLTDKQQYPSYESKKADLKNEKDRLEAQLSRLSQPFAMKQEMAKADCEKIARLLVPQIALVEFARIETIKSKNKDKATLPDRYISFVLHAGDGNRISMVDLGDADNIDRLITQYKQEIYRSGNAKKDVVTGTSQKLYDLVFRPLLKDLGTVKEIFISPDGNLNLMPFEVLQGPDGRFLIEDYTFNYLASGRDIIGFGKNPGSGGKYLLMGDPDFNLGSDEKMAVLNRINIKNDMEMLLAKRSANFNEVSFEPLHYAREELDDIGDIMGRKKSEIYSGKEALEEILMNKPVPEILHLATHGFFLNDQDLPSSGRGWQTADLPKKDEHPSDRIDRVINVENPLLRSGILLAGAKQSLFSGDTGKNDGIVTAEKILGLNLHGTKMVVLSACDTGLGEVECGEGVFGLRRAFTQAGAKSLVMSLWKVPDRETKELMVQFYRNIKSGSMNRCHALRQAVLEQMKIVRQRYGHANPRYWGAFVFMGEP